MEYFSQRNGLRKSTERTENITRAMYEIILKCCEHYYDNVAYKFPAKDCPDGDYTTGLDLSSLSNYIQFEIPDLYNNEQGLIDAPESWDDFNQYALLDYIEFMAGNMKDIDKHWHGFFQHDHLEYKETNSIVEKFREEINQLFKQTGLLYELTEKNQVERITEYIPLITTFEEKIDNVPEDGLRKLLEEAVNLYKSPDPNVRQLSIEKLWDAFERLKTYYTEVGKKVQ